MSVYIVYTYNRKNVSCSRKILGCYLDKEEAKKRQETFGVESYKNSPGVYYSKDGFVTFINVFPLGESNIEMFTTLLKE